MFGGLRISVDDVVLLALLYYEFSSSLEKFVAGIKVSNSKFEAMVFHQKKDGLASSVLE